MQGSSKKRPYTGRHSSCRQMHVLIVVLVRQEHWSYNRIQSSDTYYQAKRYSQCQYWSLCLTLNYGWQSWPLEPLSVFAPGWARQSHYSVFLYPLLNSSILSFSHLM